MSTFSSSHFPSSSSSNDEYPVLTSSELSWLLLNQEMNFAVANTFSSSPLSTVLLWQYLFLSHNLERIRQDLLCHQQEWESIFDVLSNSGLFQDVITPIVLNFRLQQRRVSPINPPSQFWSSSTSPSPAPTDKRRTVIIQERSDSNESLLSFYTTRDEPGTRNNPIDVNSFLNPPPSPPRIPVYTPLRIQSAPITAPCSMCQQHGHTPTQCIWYGPRICSYCEEVGHMIHRCNVFRWDQQRFNPHLLYCMTCSQPGHRTLAIVCHLTTKWASSLESLDDNGGVMLHFHRSVLCLLSTDYFCYLWYLVFHFYFSYFLKDPDFFSIFVIFVDNDYAYKSKLVTVETVA